MTILRAIFANPAVQDIAFALFTLAMVLAILASL
jgi:hypothetical protein